MSDKKEFKAESKRLLDLMINSIYTHKEIFLRELISNASDASDKLYYKALQENITSFSREDMAINLIADKENRTLTIADEGIGMTKEELEEHLGTIANSGSYEFKNALEKGVSDVDIIGQFGVGFYSAFMVADEVEVYSKKYGEDKAYLWKSDTSDGYTVEEVEKAEQETDLYYTLYGDLIKAVDNAKDDVDRPISVPEKVADLMELTFQGAELLDIENTTFGVQLAILDGKTLKIVELTQIYTWKSTTWKVSEQEVPTVIMDAFKASEYGNDPVESIYMFTDANGAFHKFNVIHNGLAVTVEFDVFGNIVTNK